MIGRFWPPGYSGVTRPTPGTPLNVDAEQANGLVGIWPLWEGAGSLVNDLVGRRHGVLTDYDISTRKRGWADDEFGSVPDLQNPTSATVIGYVRIGDIDLSLSKYTISVLARRNATLTNRTIFGWQTPFASLIVLPNGDIQVMDATGTLDAGLLWPGVWTNLTTHHTIDFVVHGVGASQDATLYFDGIDQGTKTGTLDALTGFSIGRSLTGPGTVFTGSILHARIFNIEKTADEAFRMFDPATRWDLFKPIIWRGCCAAVTFPPVPPEPPIPPIPPEPTGTGTAEPDHRLEIANAFLADLYNRRRPFRPGHHPYRYLELHGATIIEPTAFEPDPTTYRQDYYYNSITNRLYKKIITDNRPKIGIIRAHWKPVSD